MPYTIVVKRHKAPAWSGTLTYQGTTHVTAPCYWNPTKRIPEYDNSKCSKTFMDTKLNSKGGRREAIFLPAVSGHKGIFIHYGKNLDKVNQVSVWSDGCIVLDEDNVLKIWNDIRPENGHNVRVTIRDA